MGILRVLVADDHWIARSAIEHLLPKLGHEVCIFEADTREKTIEVATTTEDLDIIILDLNMPGGDAWQTISRLREIAPSTPVVVMSVSERRADVLRCLQEGAVGYLPKTASPEMIISTLRRVLTGEVALPQRLLVNDDDGSTQVLADDEQLARICAALEDFTPRQKEIFCILATGASNHDIARDLELSVNTVRVHLQSISSKLKTRNRSEIALCASRWIERAA